MAQFYIYETVGFELELIDESTGDPVDLTGWKEIIVSLKQGAVIIEKVNPPVNPQEGIINLSLSQSETGRFRDGDVEIQVNIYYHSTERDVSCKGAIRALDNLHKKVIV